MTDIQFKVGDAVQLRNGWEAEVLDVVGGQEWCVFIRYRDEGRQWDCLQVRADGRVDSDEESPIDLIHKPKRMSGFVNVYRDKHGEVWTGDICRTRAIASCSASSRAGVERIDCIDLSERVEGQGL